MSLVPIIVSSSERRSDAEYQAAKRGWLTGFAAGSRKNIEGYMAYWERFCTDQAVMPFDVTRSHMRVFALHLEHRNLMPSTRVRYLGMLRSFYRWCVEEGVLDKDPAAHIKLPHVADGVHRSYMDRPEAARFLAAAGQTAEHLRPRDLAIAHLLVLNGLRVSGLTSLNIETLSHERGHQTIVVVTKGGRTATIPLAPPTYWALTAYVGERDHGPVFLGRNGRRITREVVASRVRAITKVAKIDKRLSPHSCRRTFVTGALDAGVSLRDVQHAAMHSDPRTTEKYDQGRRSLDAHPTYVLGGHFSGG